MADIFVETPTAAAKIIVDRINALLAQLDSLRQELGFNISDILNALKNNLTALRSAIKSPLDRLQEKTQLLDELSYGLDNNMRQFVRITRERAASFIHRLDALSPLAVLSRGYSLSMLLPDEVVIKEAGKIKVGDLVKTVLAKGLFLSRVEEVK